MSAGSIVRTPNRRKKYSPLSTFVDKLLLSPQEKDMKNGDREEIRLEVRDRLENGRQKGKTEVETVSDIVWKERQKQYALLLALEEITQVASAALDREKERFNKPAEVLEWRQPFH
jgi:hypothetical protein